MDTQHSWTAALGWSVTLGPPLGSGTKDAGPVSFGVTALMMGAFASTFGFESTVLKTGGSKEEDEETALEANGSSNSTMALFLGIFKPDFGTPTELAGTADLGENRRLG